MAAWVALVIYVFLSTAALGQDRPPAPDGLCAWEMRDLAGDALRGRAIAVDPHAGNCLACHQMPIPEEAFHGTIGPPLGGVGARYNAAQLRAKVVDEREINPFTIMPGFYADPRVLHRVATDYWGKSFLQAQQVEDLVAYLETLQ